eukprot:SAG22_NODE_122_length_18920_cov_23.494076_19_plen_90_part_00
MLQIDTPEPPNPPRAVGPAGAHTTASGTRRPGGLAGSTRAPKTHRVLGVELGDNVDGRDHVVVQFARDAGSLGHFIRGEAKRETERAGA